MKEINAKEIEAVSGGVFSGFGGSLGQIIGSIVDRGTALSGKETNYASAGKELGAGIGSIFSLNTLNAVTGISNGILGIIASALGRNK